MTKHFLLSALAAAGAFVLTAGIAQAEQIVMMANENVFAVQDLNSAPIGTIAQGTIGEASQCGSGWCFVDRPAGAAGWVSARSIDTVANQTGPGKMFPGNPQPHQPNQPNPPNNGFPNFNFQFGIGNNNPRPNPRPPVVREDD